MREAFIHAGWSGFLGGHIFGIYQKDRGNNGRVWEKGQVKWHFFYTLINLFADGCAFSLNNYPFRKEKKKSHCEESQSVEVQRPRVECATWALNRGKNRVQGRPMGCTWSEFVANRHAPFWRAEIKREDMAIFMHQSPSPKKCNDSGGRRKEDRKYHKQNRAGRLSVQVNTTCRCCSFFHHKGLNPANPIGWLLDLPRQNSRKREQIVWLLRTASQSNQIPHQERVREVIRDHRGRLQLSWENPVEVSLFILHQVLIK